MGVKKKNCRQKSTKLKFWVKNAIFDKTTTILGICQSSKFKVRYQ